MSGTLLTTHHTIESLTAASAKLAPDGSAIPRKFLPIPAREGHRIGITVTLEDVHTRDEWAKAYAEQGSSDLDVYERLADPKVALPSCHWLHYLQMAAEKIAKAYRLRDPQESLATLLTSHVATGEFVRKYLSSPAMKKRFEGKNEQLAEHMKEMKHVAGEIEKLAPAVDREKMPHNVEYPWSDGVRITVLSKIRFAIQDLPKTSIPGLVVILREVSESILTR